MKIFTLFFLLMFALPAKSLSLGDRPLTEIYKTSVVVVKAAVISIEASCRNEFSCTQYRISFINKGIIKGSSSLLSDSISVCSKIPLDVGDEYTLFLESFDRKEKGSKECSFQLNYDGAFAERAGDFFRFNSPDSKQIATNNGKKYYTNAIYIDGFAEELQTLAGR